MSDFPTMTGLLKAFPAVWTLLVLATLVARGQEPVVCDTTDKMVIKTIVRDGEGRKAEKSVQVVIGESLQELQGLIDSLLRSVDRGAAGLSGLEVIKVPGPDGFETLNWLEFKTLDEFGKFMPWGGDKDPGSLDSGRADRPFLGVILDTDARTDSGLLILDVVQQSAAWEAGLRKNDILVAVDRDSVNSLEDLMIALKTKGTGARVEITYLRNDQIHVSETTLKAYGDSRQHLAGTWGPWVPDCCKADASCSLHEDKVYKVFAHQKRPRLGVHLEELDEEMISDLRVPGDKGVLITRVIEGTAASDMGLKVNDVLIRINEQEISGISHLGELLSEMKIGDEIKLDLIRYGVAKSASGTLFEFNDNPFIDRMIFHEQGSNGE